MEVKNSSSWKCLFANLEVVNGGEGKYCTYFNPNTIEPVKGFFGITGVKALTLEDYEMPQKSSINSSKHMSYAVYQEFHIKEPKIMRLHLSFHSENMGEGVVIFSSEIERKWMPIIKGTVDYYLWEGITALYKGK